MSINEHSEMPTTYFSAACRLTICSASSTGVTVCAGDRRREALVAGLDSPPPGLDRAPGAEEAAPPAANMLGATSVASWWMVEN